MSLQTFAIAFGKYVPQLLCNTIYWGSFYLIQMAFKHKGYSVSPRSSLVTGRVNFGSSDIDLNLWTEAPFEPIQFQKTESKIKQYIPVMGEVNVLSEQSVKSMLKFINPYLLEKDPILVNKLNLLLREGTRAEKTCYILHCLKFNRLQLETSQTSNVNKWNYYFSQIGMASPKDLSVQQVCCCLENLVNGLDFEYLQSIPLKSDSQINEFYLSGEVRTEMMCLTPVIWLGAANLYQSIEIDLIMLSKHEDKLYLFVEGLKWELWGIYTQRFFQPRHDVLTHLHKIKNVFDILSQTSHNEIVSHLIEGIDELMEIVGNGE